LKPDAGACQRKDVLLVVRDRSAPGRPVDETLALRGIALCFECCDGGRLGQAVQRHVDERRVAAGRGGAGGGVEAFPLGAAGLVDVDVGVHQAGQDGVVAAVVDVDQRRAASSSGRRPARIFPVFHDQCGGRVPGGDDAVREIGLCHNFIIS
jgi:hypothetical protein